jgi:hypothetical protein
MHKQVQCVRSDEAAPTPVAAELDESRERHIKEVRRTGADGIQKWREEPEAYCLCVTTTTAVCVGVGRAAVGPGPAAAPGGV